MFHNDEGVSHISVIKKIFKQSKIVMPGVFHSDKKFGLGIIA